jgi:hypothetical protein
LYHQVTQNMNDIFIRNTVIDPITGDFMNIVPISNWQEEFEDTKWVIRFRISKKNRQHNGQKKKVQKDKQRSIKHTYTTKDRVTRAPLKTGGELGSALRLYHPSATLYIIPLCHSYSEMLQGGTIAMSMGKDVDNW